MYHVLMYIQKTSLIQNILVSIGRQNDIVEKKFYLKISSWERPYSVTTSLKQDNQNCVQTWTFES